MAREDVNIKVTANVAEAIQLWKAMEAGPDGMAKALDGMGKKGKESTKSLGDELTGYIGKWASGLAAVSAVTDAIRSQRDALRELRAEQLAATNSVDQMMTSFQLNAGLPSGPQADAIRNQLLAIIAERKASPQVAFPAATQMLSSGSSMEELMQGGGLAELLNMQNALDQMGKGTDGATLAKAISQFLSANKKRPTGENIRELGIAFQGMKETNLNIVDLEQFASRAFTIQQATGMKSTEQLGVFSQFLDSMDASVGATAFRSGVVSLATAGANTQKTRALAMLGLKPGDIDFQGESFFDVQKTLAGAFGKLSGDKRNIAAKLLFGQEGLPFYDVLLGPQAPAESAYRSGLANDVAGYNQAIATTLNSRDAKVREAETLSTYGLIQQGMVDPEVIKGRLNALIAQEGLDESESASVRAWFDDPRLFPVSAFNWALPDPLPNFRARSAARRMVNLSDIPYADTQAAIEEKYQQMMGQQEIRIKVDPIRIQGPNGLDIPTEPAAVHLNDQ